MGESGRPPSSSMRDLKFQGSTTSSTVHRESQVLVPGSGAEQIAAVNISGLAGGAQSLKLGILNIFAGADIQIGQLFARVRVLESSMFVRWPSTWRIHYENRWSSFFPFPVPLTLI